jgi:hypothetical protein
MSTVLRKCISLGPDGMISPGPGNPQSLHFQNVPGSYANLIFLTAGGTRWLKLWVDLFKLWPGENNVDLNMRDQLDYQIALAKSHGLGVILTINHRLPRWITGAAAPDPNNQTQVDKYSQLMPRNTDPDGPWAFAFASLASRYSAANPNRPWGGLSLVDIIEFCNEPNQSMLDSTYNLAGDVAGTVAILFKRARKIVNDLGGSPIVGGPATSDLDTTHLPNRRNYFDFTDDVLQRLAGNGFYRVGSDTTCVWTHHNYTDISYDQGAGTNAPSSKGLTPYMNGIAQFDRRHLRSAWVRFLLVQRGWKGFPYGLESDPRLLLTEGGTTRAVLDKEWGAGAPKRLSDADYRVTQALLMARNIIRLGDDTPAGGAGVDMLTNYLQITVPEHDSGMFETNLSARSLFTDVWKPLPGRL